MKEIKGYNNYLIYPDGRVWSKNINGFLKELNNDDGYKQVGLWKDGINKTCKIHRLVAEHYIPNPDNKKEVDHRYRDKTDNRVESLRWVTRSENNQNIGIRKDNKTGHKNISYHKKDNRYVYNKMYNKVKHQKNFKTLTDALCYKYIFILKIRAGLIN